MVSKLLTMAEMGSLDDLGRLVIRSLRTEALG